MSIYLASDHHLFHDKIIQFSRPQFSSIEEHNEFIIDQHNSVIKDDDIVYFLGDVCLSAYKSDQYSILHRFNGRKRLILGNHESPERVKSYHEYFEKVQGYHSIGNKNGRDSKVLLSHIPVHPCQLEDRFEINIHGHLHHEIVRLPDGSPDKRYVCVSMERINYIPVSLDSILEMKGE